MNRKRPLYIGLLILTIVCGLLSRSPFLPLPSFIAEYAGDTLWATMVFWLFGGLFLKHPTWKIAVYALLFSYAIEVSQFYQAPWINEIRQTKLGGLVLGFGFKASDLACYTVGIAIGFCIDHFLNRPNQAKEF